jgi:hypothetical protein
MTQDERIDRYLRLVHWARRRYTVGNRLDVSIGGRATRYKRIEQAAFARYFPLSAAA